MSKRFVCVHGHFYQPPRENPWTQAIDPQPSAAPFRDWNERILHECYRPNTASRILDAEGNDASLTNNFARISFNIGPTLLGWMEHAAPEVHAAIVAADAQSLARFGHGSAMAQAYNHLIMPLAREADRVLQIQWGIQDFVRRFGRKPEGMWLPETAVDTATLEALAAQDIAFTLLAPHQARRHRRIGDARWDTSPIDTRHVYRAHLPSGRSIDLFFYHGEVSHEVAFHRLLDDGATFARRLLSLGDGLSHIATDGESYGHHHAHGDMALAFALDAIDRGNDAELINYAAYRARFPARHEVEIAENTSWSCAHGVERWRSDCGCNSGGKPGWHQRWRAPLRAALDWLRDALPALSDEPSAAELELQLQLQLMYTSCGWFFDDISGIETVQILQYGARALELAHQTSGLSLEAEFVDRLAAAPSNVAEFADGRGVYEALVKRRS